jgi:hypothetical protein
MDRINDFLEQWRRGLFLLALIVGGAGIKAAILMLFWIALVIALEFALGWVWLEDYTLWVFGAAVVAWLPYYLALVLKTKEETYKQEWARQQAYQSYLEATEPSSTSDA